MQRSLTSAYVALWTRFEEIREVDRERGLTTTEIAVLTFILVALAVAVGAILYNYASGQAESLPENPTADFEVDSTTG